MTLLCANDKAGGIKQCGRAFQLYVRAKRIGIGTEAGNGQRGIRKEDCVDVVLF